MKPLDVLRVLLLYHLVELVDGKHATRIEVRLDPSLGIVVRDDGRGMGIDRAIGGRPYLDRVFGQLDLIDEALPLQPAHLQIHAIGLSLMARGCRTLRVIVDRGSERREGIWNPSTATVDWTHSQPTSSQGTCIAAWPHAGLPDAAAVREIVERLDSRCGDQGAVVFEESSRF